MINNRVVSLTIVSWSLKKIPVPRPAKGMPGMFLSAGCIIHLAKGTRSKRRDELLILHFQQTQLVSYRTQKYVRPRPSHECQICFFIAGGQLVVNQELIHQATLYSFYSVCKLPVLRNDPFLHQVFFILCIMEGVCSYFWTISQFCCDTRARLT